MLFLLYIKISLMKNIFFDYILQIQWQMFDFSEWKLFRQSESSSCSSTFWLLCLALILCLWYLLVISTPNYPRAYNNGENKQWPIQAPAGQHIRFEFTDFSIEDHKTCGYDWVQVIDGNGQELLKKSCGDTKPKSFLSKTNKATVKFHSDGSTTRKGFRLEYSFKKDSQGGKKHLNKTKYFRLHL